MLNLEILPPLRQTTWGIPAAANLTLGGAGVGFYVVSMLLAILEGNKLNQSQFIEFRLLAPGIVCCGFLALALEAGRPARARHLFTNMLGSWMSIESLAGALFIAAALADWFSPHFLIKAVAISAALIFIVSQGFIVYRAEAVTAWNVPLTPVIFATSGFMTACGLFLLNSQPPSGAVFAPAVMSLVCILLNLALWLLYIYWYQDADFQDAAKLMRRPGSLLVTVGIGHIMPLVLLLYILVTGSPDNGFQLLPIVRVLTGLALILGGVSQKAGIILKAGFYRPIVLRAELNKR